jgi:hypothetical protein
LVNPILYGGQHPLCAQVCKFLVPHQLLSAGMAATASSGRLLEEFSMAFVTAPNQEKAQELAHGIVKQELQLVGCRFSLFLFCLKIIPSPPFSKMIPVCFSLVLTAPTRLHIALRS